MQMMMGGWGRQYLLLLMLLMLLLLLVLQQQLLLLAHHIVQMSIVLLAVRVRVEAILLELCGLLIVISGMQTAPSSTSSSSSRLCFPIDNACSCCRCLGAIADHCVAHFTIQSIAAAVAEEVGDHVAFALHLDGAATAKFEVRTNQTVDNLLCDL